MRVAITGGIAEGKSAVLGVVAERGLPVFSADAFAREVFLEPETQRMLTGWLGQPPTPAALREAMTLDPALRRSVNRWMHPRVLDRILAEPHGYFEVPLLLEACLQSHFGRIWGVTCGAEEQARRLRARYGPETDVEAILATQLPTRVKLAFSHEIIRTNAPPEAVRVRVAEAIRDAVEQT
jgi:dephospho-CoA kinase